jgi:hypothetical protein
VNRDFIESSWRLAMLLAMGGPSMMDTAEWGKGYAAFSVKRQTTFSDQRAGQESNGLISTNVSDAGALRLVSSFSASIIENAVADRDAIRTNVGEVFWWRQELVVDRR